MGWQYRVCKETVGEGDFQDIQYTLREVLSDKPGATIEDEICFSEKPCYPYGSHDKYDDGLEQLKSDFDYMKKAFDLPVLDLDEWEKLRSELKQAKEEHKNGEGEPFEFDGDE